MDRQRQDHLTALTRVVYGAMMFLYIKNMWIHVDVFFSCYNINWPCGYDSGDGGDVDA